MLNRASRLAMARIVLALMLFAQGALAWAACQLPERAPELALRAAVEHQGCEQLSEPTHASASVCFTHTLSEKQSLYKTPLDIHSTPAGPVLIISGSPTFQSKAREPRRLSIAPTGGPPRRILLQSFQI